MKNNLMGKLSVALCATIIFAALYFLQFVPYQKSQKITETYIHATTREEVMLRMIREKVLVPRNSSMEKRFLADMQNLTLRAALRAQYEDFYEFGVYDVDAKGGGVMIIAFLNPGGHFEKISTGQEEPSCAPVERYKVPVELVPICFDRGGERGRVDRYLEKYRD